MITVVTGYRFWQNPRTVWNRMQRLQDECALRREGLEVGVGDCSTGVDAFIRDWAVTAPVLLRIFYADWDTHDRAAGPLRNIDMINTMRPEKVIAFLHPKSKGTKQCAGYADSLGIPVERIWEGR